MNNKTQNCCNIVLQSYDQHDCDPQDVGRSMIEFGCQKQPFYIFDMDEAFRRIQHFKNLMPRVQIFYAMKSNDTEIMLKLAIASGLGFDCASPVEIYKLRQLNASPESIIYTTPTKTTAHMRYARQSGVKYTMFDSSYELKKLKDNWPDARLLLRVRVGCGNEMKLEEEYGCDFETEAVDLLEEAASLGLRVIGVAFHLGRTCTINSYLVGLKYARALFDHEALAGRKMRVVDIGGGFAGDRTDRIDQVSKLINRGILEMFPDPQVQIIAEPGKYISESAFTLYCSIISVHKVKRNDKTVNMIYLNDGLYGTIRYSENWHRPTKFKRYESKESEKLEETIMWGPTCDSYDRIMKTFAVELPRLTPNDWLVFQNHGAYTFTFATRFSSLPIPLIRPVISLNTMLKLKNNKVFSANDFIMQGHKSTALPLTIPPLSSKCKPSSKKACYHLKTSTLIVQEGDKATCYLQDNDVTMADRMLTEKRI